MLELLPRLNALAAVVLLCLTSIGSLAAEPLRIAVIGGTGRIGMRIVSEALDRGHSVTAIVRDPSRYTGQHERLTLEQGDVLDQASLKRVLEGQHVVVSAVGSARAQSPDPTLYRRAAESLIATLRGWGTGAPRLIVIGGVGSLQHPSGGLIIERMPPERQPESLGQKAALDYYRTVSDVAWTYVSPPASITPGERTGVFRIGGDQLLLNDKGESRISMEDYAVAIVNEAEAPRHLRQRFTVAY